VFKALFRVRHRRSDSIYMRGIQLIHYVITLPL